MLSKPGGDVLFPDYKLCNRISALTDCDRTTRKSPLGGFSTDKLPSSSLVGFDCIVVGSVGRPEEVATGETIMVRFAESDTVKQP